jgi:hypothetical protein
VLTPCVDEITGEHWCEFDVIDELLLKYSALVRYRRKNGNIMGQYRSYL